MKNKYKTLGILGGGQLGRMFCQSAQAMGFAVCVLDPANLEDSPAASIADIHIQADYEDIQALDYMADICMAISIEFENVPASTLEYLNNKNCFIAPNSYAVSIAQDRVKEKSFFQSLNLSVAPFYIIDTLEDINNLDIDENFFPAILKTSTLGYDGKGQLNINSFSDLKSKWQSLNQVKCILEKRINILNEISVILARDKFGNIANYPIGQNIHKDGILFSSTVPSSNTPTNISETAYECAKKIAIGIDYIGVLCIEFFVVEGEKLYINEIAPRPHNSGHYTQNACITSQFEQQARILAGFPLGSTKQHTPVVLINILGDSWYKNSEDAIEPDWSKFLQYNGVQLHLYGKNIAKKGRKMGHINCLADTIKQAQNIANNIENLL